MTGLLIMATLLAPPAYLGLPATRSPAVAAVVDGEGPGALELGHELPAGAPLTLSEGAALTLWVYPDTLWSFQGPGRFVVDPGEVYVIQCAHVPTRVTAPALADAPVIDQTSTLNERPHAPTPPMAILRPADEAIPAEQRGLRWSAPPGQQVALTLTLGDPDGDGHTLERWTGLRGGQLRTWAPLEPGRWYHWEVSTPTASDGRWFYVWTSAEHEALEAALNAELPARGPHPKLAAAAVRALVLERAGAWTRAAARWRELLAVRPDAPGLSARVRAIEGRVVRPPRAGLPAIVARLLKP